jgi:hypothetical protein
MPSMSVLPEDWKRSMSTVLTDLDLSMIVSVPTSRRPIERGSMLYFSSKFATAAKRIGLARCALARCTRRMTRAREEQKMGRTGEGKGVDVFAVVTAGHELLAKADGVLALGNTVEDLKILLRNALHIANHKLAGAGARAADARRTLLGKYISMASTPTSFGRSVDWWTMGATGAAWPLPLGAREAVIFSKRECGGVGEESGRMENLRETGCFFWQVYIAGRMVGGGTIV